MVTKLLPSLLSIDPRNMASRFKELLQTVVNICVNGKVKYPGLTEFLERIKFYDEDLKKMKHEIIMPTDENEFIRDPDLENKILGLVTNENWGQVGDLFLQIPMKNYCELNKFMMKLFEIVTEEHH